MRKLMKATLVVMLFASALLLLQMCSKENVIAQAAAYVLPIATPTVLGGVKPDGTTITVDGTGRISAVAELVQTSLPISTTTTLGGVKPDGTTITADATGIISSTGIQKLNKIIYTISATASSQGEIWTANYDGTNQTKVNVTLPTGAQVVNAGLSPDGKKVFIGLQNSSDTSWGIYSCNIDGTNLIPVVGFNPPNYVNFNGAY